MMKPLLHSAICITALTLGACSDQVTTTTQSATTTAKGATTTANSIAVNVTNTCSGTYPSYWQDPAEKFAGMWQGQQISDAPPADWQGPVFQISDLYPTELVDDSAAQGWRAEKFDAMFNAETAQDTKRELAEEYAWLVMNYIQEGNVNQQDAEDWDVCENKVRPWFNIPFQTYDAMSGREFTHGLTREAPVTFSTQSDGLVKSSMWAIGFFNETAAYTLGTVWGRDGKATIPTENVSFAEGAVVGKPLFNTASTTQLPVMANLPSWNANISDPAFCACTPANGKECTLIEESQQCPRSTTQWDGVRLLQFDFAVKDSRAPGTQWVFGTFVADGQRKATEPDQWKRISPLGVMWGNDTPPAGELAYDYPQNVRQNGFKEEVIFWDVVDELNKYGGDDVMKQMGHLGCNFRLNGPADNGNSSCMSCHGSASVPDNNLETPPLLSQFSAITKECVTPDAGQPTQGKDRTGSAATVNNGVSFAEVDSIYFANTAAAAPFNMTLDLPTGAKNIMPGAPQYGSDGKVSEWISLDYSLQLSISLKQWMQWQNHQQQEAASRIHFKEIRRNHP